MNYILQDISIPLAVLSHMELHVGMAPIGLRVVQEQSVEFFLFVFTMATCMQPENSIALVELLQTALRSGMEQAGRLSGGGITGSQGTLGFGDVDAMAVYNGALYVGGSFDTAGSVAANNIARWDGTNWSALGSGITGEVRSLAGYNGDLYAGGPLSAAGGVPTSNIARWNLPVSVQSTDAGKITICPNPCTGKLNIGSSYTKGVYELYDITGKLLMKNIFSSLKFEIDFSEFKSGIYFLTLRDEKMQIHSKIVKE